MVVSEHVRYLDNGISRHLPENFLPDASVARFAKAAGWYHIFHIDDLRAIAPRWLHYTEQMRSNPQKYFLRLLILVSGPVLFHARSRFKRRNPRLEQRCLRF